MDQREEGWPLGLQPLSVRLGLIRNLDYFGSLSFSSVMTASSRSNSFTSSHFDSESFGSLSHERNATLGSLIGTRGSTLELSRRSFRRSRRQENFAEKKGKNWTWFSLCTRPHLDVANGDESPSLGQFLEKERRACNLQRLQGVQPVSEGGSYGFCYDNGHGLPLIFQCIGGQVSR